MNGLVHYCVTVILVNFFQLHFQTKITVKYDDNITVRTTYNFLKILTLVHRHTNYVRTLISDIILNNKI